MSKWIVIAESCPLKTEKARTTTEAMPLPHGGLVRCLVVYEGGPVTAPQLAVSVTYVPGLQVSDDGQLTHKP